MVVSRSSAEAEYHSLAVTTSELTWIVQFLKDLHVSSPAHALLFCDNNSAIYIASNLVFHERMKHIELDSHYVCDKIVHGEVKLLSIPSSPKLVDIFTKP